MRLLPQETERFYRIWFALLHYVNTQLHLVPPFPASLGEQDVSPEDTIQVRDALWANNALRDRFIVENPPQLPAVDLELVASRHARLAAPFGHLGTLRSFTILV